ncbi:MAG: hypothetical protein HXY50_14375 [Ignavibacteriaceae bacterium]|nr:hypothetical protein [Ignavibacteriaceae bacterium]
MKTLTYMFTFLCFSSILFSQVHTKMKALQKMEELKKLKLIEILEMDEETSIKFFTKRAEHLKKIENLNKTGKLKIQEIEELIEEKNDVTLTKAIEEYFNVQENISKEKQNFYSLISGILKPHQMAKFIVFEDRFRSEISGLLFRERNKRQRNN